jgi:hypothetical protein
VEGDLDERDDQSHHWAGSGGMENDNSAGLAKAEDEW